MKPIKLLQDFPGTHVVFAEDQTEYIPLPVVIPRDNENVVLSKWELTDEERAKIVDGGYIYVQQMNFGQPLQPINIQIELDDEDVKLL